MAEAELIGVHEDYNNDVKTDCDDRKVDRILHHATL